MAGSARQAGGRQRLNSACVRCRCRKPHPPLRRACSMACSCPRWRCSARYVVEPAAQPGSFSRAKSACHESWCGCGPRARLRWALLGDGCASLLPLCTLVLRKQQRCWLEYLSAVFLWCLVACEMRVAVSQNVAVVGWGPAVNPLCQCVSNARPRRGALCLALDPCCDDCLKLLLLMGGLHSCSTPFIPTRRKSRIQLVVWWWQSHLNK